MVRRDRFVLATRNPAKTVEIIQICADWPVEWVTYRDVSWPEVEEVGCSYLENANLKAGAAAHALGLPAVAEDSGIEVDALNGRPGVRSARYAGPSATDRENLDLLLANLMNVPWDKRRARYHCVTVCAWPDGKQVSAEGTCQGHLLSTPRGSHGFGYDPIFVPDGYRETMAELSSMEKNRISHRGKALRALAGLLRRE